MKNSLVKLALAGCLISGVATADELSDSWSGSAGISALLTSGNSDNKNIAGSVNISKQADIWRHNAFGNIFTAEANGDETANRMELGYKLDRKFNEVMYGFGRLRYDSDDYGNIDGRFSGVIGVGRSFINDGKVTFGGEVGIGAHSTDYMTPVGGDSSAEGAVVYVGANYSNIINQNLTFFSNLGAEIADSNTLTVWDNSLSFRVSDRISLAVGLLTRNNSDIVGDLGEKTDTTTRISLNYGI